MFFDLKGRVTKRKERREGRKAAGKGEKRKEKRGEREKRNVPLVDSLPKQPH